LFTILAYLHLLFSNVHFIHWFGTRRENMADLSTVPTGQRRLGSRMTSSRQTSRVLGSFGRHTRPCTGRTQL
jgi:hypothetical protein